MPSLTIIYASTSGHTEYVCDQLIASLKEAGIEATKIRAEEAKPEDLTPGGPLILASSTWNTGNQEGKLNPHMHSLLLDRGKDVKLSAPVACIALGDDRYRYTANASVHLEEFVKTHGGMLMVPTLKIVNEPYGQEAKVQKWAEQLSPKLVTRNS